MVESLNLSLTFALWVLGVGMFLLIIFLVIRMIVRKLLRAVEEEYQQNRYEKYSKLVDGIVAGIPDKDLIHIKKQPGDKKVLQTLLGRKLLYIKGDDRTRVVNKLRELSFVSMYVSELSSSKAAERATALQVLGDLRITETAGNFTEALEDTDGDVRLTAVRGLGNMVDEISSSGQNGTRTGPIIETIVGLLDKPEEIPDRRLAEVILGLGPDAVPPLLVATQSSNARTRALAADILGQIGDWRGVDTLIEMLNDPETDVRTQAAGALGSTGDTRAVKPLIKSLDDEAWPVRARGARALSVVGDPVAVYPISRLLSDPQWWVRYNAGFALPSFKELGYETLEKTLLDSDRYARERALEVMEETGYLHQFIEDLASDNDEKKTRAMKLLIIVGNAGGLAPLIDATREIDDPRSIGTIIEIWRNITEHLVEYLNSESHTMKMQAIESVNKMNYSYVVEKIDLFGQLDIEGTGASIVEIAHNIERIKKSLELLKQDLAVEIRDEAFATLSFMERK